MTEQKVALVTGSANRRVGWHVAECLPRTDIQLSCTRGGRASTLTVR